MDRPDDAALLAEADDYRAASGKPWRVLIPELTAALRAALQREQEMAKEIGRLREWRDSVSSAIKTIPEFHLPDAWHGDREGWGFHFEMVNYCRRQREAAERELSTLRARTEQE